MMKSVTYTPLRKKRLLTVKEFLDYTSIGEITLLK